MQGSLALARGTLFVGLQEKTARVRAYDRGGRALPTSFSFRDARTGRSAVAGLAVDEDRALWIADTPADRVRVFTLFGREVGGIGAPAEERAPVLPGLVSRPVDVDVQGHRDQGQIAIACGGERRHAVQLFEPDLSFRASCAALGDPNRPFQAVTRIAASGPLLYVAESLGRRVQVFRAGEFLFAFQLRSRSGEPFEPSALAPLADGRVAVACRAPHAALFLVDGSGRPLRCLAEEGAEEGAVLDPSDLALDAAREAGEAGDERRTELYVLDRDGLRVQVFTLEGRCLGALALEGSGEDTARSKPDRGARQE